MHTSSGQCCVHLYGRILSTSFTSISIFSAWCYSSVSISMGTSLQPAGGNNSTMGELMDSLFSCWSKDPVHGDKIAYHRMAMGLLDILSRKGDLRNSLNPKKRGREDTPPPRGRAQSPPRRRRSSDDSAYGSYSEPPLRQPHGPQEQLP
jgi:hypothetical protein